MKGLGCSDREEVLRCLHTRHVAAWVLGLSSLKANWLARHISTRRSCSTPIISVSFISKCEALVTHPSTDNAAAGVEPIGAPGML